ncbi:hypothetical protein M5E88_00840 [Akkermansia muciniphila]|nr:hypothetical protein M5E88_00840 [Akkermansia muciniphila]
MNLQKTPGAFLYPDSRHFGTKLLHIDLTTGTGGIPPHNHDALKTSILSFSVRSAKEKGCFQRVLHLKTKHLFQKRD